MLDQLRVSLLGGPRSEPFGYLAFLFSLGIPSLTSLIASIPPALTRNRSTLQGPFPYQAFQSILVEAILSSIHHNQTYHLIKYKSQSSRLNSTQNHILSAIQMGTENLSKVASYAL